ncbi:tRNA (adenosine(37)-N6)-dimethylallyltransferase MiaA [uncultured Mailhella sp.]|uniref:tRNA (adenosine(37)-N6)-dimethylallyltransferase MiaA n=1 Tax=uncultured Mailhella sp. TaxID=1981031 RepID=UPI0025E186A3|nr:tRNA (adenosine(37)-N6)-dimethylallyltransferase MiaA [uncultured Mailhella sp.]
MSTTPGILCLVGPTGSGKTAASLHLAAMLEKAGRPVAVINADSRQVYRDFPVITAQPSAEERSVCPHRLYGWLETTGKISAGQWADMACAAIRETLAEGRIPMLVGGTGFYLRALLDGIAAIPPVDPAITARLSRECEKLGAPALHARLAAIDPDYAAKIHPNDSQRNVRALEVWEATGKTFSWWHSQTTPPAPWPVLRLGIGLPLPELSPFLRKRIDIMLEQGALTEARRALAACPDTSAPGWSGIGCAETAAFLQGNMSLPECLELWMKNTRAYAKRQWTWFRADKRILWFRPGEHRNLEAPVKEFLGI